MDGLKMAKRLRNEMEKVRLLMELMRKREKLKLIMVGGGVVVVSRWLIDWLD